MATVATHLIGGYPYDTLTVMKIVSKKNAECLSMSNSSIILKAAINVNSGKIPINYSELRPYSYCSWTIIEQKTIVLMEYDVIKFVIDVTLI